MEDLDKSIQNPGETAQETTEAAQQTIASVTGAVEQAAAAASQAAQDAPDQIHHELMGRVASVLDAVGVELKRANDLREYEQKQAQAALDSAAQAETPVAEIVTEKPVKMIRRGARKVKRA